MTIEERREMFRAYIDANVAPLLVENANEEIFHDPVIIPANCDVSLLTGHYENDKFEPPPWYKELIAKKDVQYNYLVISDITSTSKDEQLKFVELLKHRKISDFELPENVVIIVLASSVNRDLIAEEIYSLVAHI